MPSHQALALLPLRRCIEYVGASLVWKSKQVGEKPCVVPIVTRAMAALRVSWCQVCFEVHPTAHTVGWVFRLHTMAAVGLETVYPVLVGALALFGLGLGVKIILEKKSPARLAHGGNVGARVQAMGSTRV